MGRLSKDVVQKVSGPAWNGVREKFMEMAEMLLSVSPGTVGELTTIYVKFSLSGDPGSPVYAVAWIKNSRKWVVGLALPDEVESPELGPAPPQKMYTGLTKYFVVTPDDPLPERLAEWAREAFENVQKER